MSPPGQQAITDIVDQVPLVDPETAIFFTTLLADTEAASEAEVSNALQVTRDKMFVTNRTIASTPEVIACRPFMAAHSNGIMVLGRHKHAGAIGDAGSLGLWTLNLDTPYWRPVRATGAVPLRFSGLGWELCCDGRGR